MITFTKDINAGFGQPYVEVDSNTVGAVRANNGKYYLTQSEIELRFKDGEFHLTFLIESDFIAPIEPVFSLEQHKIEIENSVDEFINNTFILLWYSSEADISLVALDTDARWYQEAMQLTKWRNNIYTILEDYKDTATEENHQNPQDFINNLPKFNG
jgi:hypothetical protein